MNNHTASLEITVNVHESVLLRKLVFWTSNWKHVIKYDLYVKFAQIFAHNVQICAKFCCKNFNDVCQAFWILHHYTQGGVFVDTLYVHSIQLPLQRTGRDHQAIPISHGWTPSSEIWQPTTWHWTKQSTWFRTALCGGWCLHMALRTPSGACQKRRRKLYCETNLPTGMAM